MSTTPTDPLLLLAPAGQSDSRSSVVGARRSSDERFGERLREAKRATDAPPAHSPREADEKVRPGADSDATSEPVDDEPAAASKEKTSNTGTEPDSHSTSPSEPEGGEDISAADGKTNESDDELEAAVVVVQQQGATEVQDSGEFATDFEIAVVEESSSDDTAGDDNAEDTAADPAAVLEPASLHVAAPAVESVVTVTTSDAVTPSDETDQSTTTAVVPAEIDARHAAEPAATGSESAADATPPADGVVKESTTSAATAAEATVRGNPQIEASAGDATRPVGTQTDANADASPDAELEKDGGKRQRRDNSGQFVLNGDRSTIPTANKNSAQLLTTAQVAAEAADGAEPKVDALADASQTARGTSDGNRTDGVLSTLDRLQQMGGRATRSATNTQSGDGLRINSARFVGRVARAFQLAQDHGGTIRLRLSPPELGSLHMKVTIENGVLSATIDAETTAARNALLDNLPALRDRLAQQDVRVERFDVDVRRDGSESQQQFEPQRRDGHQPAPDRGPWRRPSAPVAETPDAPIDITEIVAGDTAINLLV